MSTPKIIAIVGATGIQGRSVANAFLSLPDWKVRALTRNPSSPAAQSLAASGAEVVQAELDDVDSLSRAFAGAYAIFLNTDFWAPYGEAVKSGVDRETSTKKGFEAEFGHAKNAVDAATQVPSLHRFVYSVLGPMKAASGGKYPHSGHWDSKAAAADYIEKRPELVGKAAFIYPAAYDTNTFLLPQIYPHLGGDREVQWALMLPGPPSTTIPVLEMKTNFGLLTRSLIVGEEAGVKLFAHDCNPNGKDLVEMWNKITGKNAKFVEESMEGMHKITGLPYEVLDGPGYLSEFHYMHGVKGKIIEPKDLKDKVPTKTLEEILRARGMDDLLGSQHPTL